MVAAPGDSTKKPSEDLRPRRRRVRGLILYLCLLAAGIFTALQVHTFWVLRRSLPPGGAAPLESAEPAAGEWPAPSGPQVIEDPLVLSGLSRFDGDPEGLPAPPGAVRRWGFQRTAHGQFQQQARYEAPLEQADAAGHYLQVLSARGFGLASDVTDESGRREMLFGRDRVAVNLSLRKKAQDGKIIIVTVVVSRPAEK